MIDEVQTRSGQTSPETVIRTFAEALADACDEYGMTSSLLVVARWQLPDEAEAVARAAVACADYGVAAFGIAGDELAQPANRFVRAVGIARDGGLLVTPHAGEQPNEASLDKLRSVVELLRPDRIAHGVRAVDDPALLDTLAERGIVCDVCPTSNLRFGIADRAADHPARRLVEAGVPITLNADNETFFGASIADEYELARRDLGFDDETLAAIAETSLSSTGARPVLTNADDTATAWLSLPE